MTASRAAGSVWRDSTSPWGWPTQVDGTGVGWRWRGCERLPSSLSGLLRETKVTTTTTPAQMLYWRISADQAWIVLRNGKGNDGRRRVAPYSSWLASGAKTWEGGSRLETVEKWGCWSSKQAKKSKQCRIAICTPNRQQNVFVLKYLQTDTTACEDCTIRETRRKRRSRGEAVANLTDNGSFVQLGTGVNFLSRPLQGSPAPPPARPSSPPDITWYLYGAVFIPLTLSVSALPCEDYSVLN